MSTIAVTLTCLYCEHTTVVNGTRATTVTLPTPLMDGLAEMTVSFDALTDDLMAHVEHIESHPVEQCTGDPCPDDCDDCDSRDPRRYCDDCLSS